MVRTGGAYGRLDSLTTGGSVAAGVVAVAAHGADRAARAGKLRHGERR
jgi:hypothetical protein